MKSNFRKVKPVKSKKPWHKPVRVILVLQMSSLGFDVSQGAEDQLCRGAIRV